MLYTDISTLPMIYYMSVAAPILLVDLPITSRSQNGRMMLPALIFNGLMTAAKHLLVKALPYEANDQSTM